MRLPAVSRQFDGGAAVARPTAPGGAGRTRRLAPGRSGIPHSVADAAENTLQILALAFPAFHLHFLGTAGDDDFLNISTRSTAKFVDGHFESPHLLYKSAGMTMSLHRRTQINRLSPKDGRTITKGVDRVNCPKGGVISAGIRPYSRRAVAVCNSRLDYLSRTGANIHSAFMKAAKETEVHFSGQLVRDSWPVQPL